MNRDAMAPSCSQPPIPLLAAPPLAQHAFGQHSCIGQAYHPCNDVLATSHIPHLTHFFILPILQPWSPKSIIKNEFLKPLALPSLPLRPHVGI